MIGQFIVKKEFLMKKKSVLVAILIVLLTLTFAIIGCGDDSGSSGVEGTWKAKLQDQPNWDSMKSMYEMMGIQGDTVMATMEFKGGKVTVTNIDPKTNEEETSEGTYTQSGNTVTMTSKDGEKGTATVSGNKLTIKSENGDEVVFKK
jgi:hypothetical protein